MIKYLIAFFVIFNTADSKADITFDLDNPDEVYEEAIPLESKIGKVSDDYSIPERGLLLVRYLNNNYPGDEIKQDFSEDVKALIPDINDEQAKKITDWSRRGILAYRFIKKKIGEIKKAIMTPMPTKIFPDEDYDKDEEKEYINTGKKDEYVFNVDIKRVLSYGDDPQDRALMLAKKNHDAGVKTKSSFEILKELKRLWDEGKYRALFFYSPSYDEKERKDTTGIGKPVVKSGVSARLISNLRGIKNSENLHLAMHFNMGKNKIMAAENSGKYSAPIINLDFSENLESYTVHRPVPMRYIRGNEETLGIYLGKFIIPIDVKIKDNSLPLVLKAQTNAIVCDEKHKCEELEFDNELELKDNDDYFSGFDSHIEQAIFRLPNQTDKIKLDDVSVEKFKDTETLCMKFVTKNKISDFDAFVEDGYKTEFLPPLVSIRDKEVFVRFFPKNSEYRFSKDSPIFVQARYNGTYSFAGDVFPFAEKESFAAEKYINVSAVLLAFFGGILLLISPAVLPYLFVLAKNREIIKVRWLTGGIILGYVLLASILTGLKIFAPKTMLWGSQFHSLCFLLICAFLVFVILRNLKNEDNASLLQLFSVDFKKKHILSALSVFCGVLLVLSSLSFSTPYLEETINQILLSNIASGFVYLFALYIGFFVPYFLFLKVKKIKNFGLKILNAKKYNVSRLFFYIAFLQFIWLAYLIYLQKGLTFVLLFIAALFVSDIILHEEKKLCTNIKGTRKISKKEIVRKLKFYVRSFIGILFLSLAAYGFFATGVAAEKSHKDFADVQSRITKINEEGKMALLAGSADWCITCKIFEYTTLFFLKDSAENKDVEILVIDAEEYMPEVLDVMTWFKHNGLPLYILYMPAAPKGIALPKILLIDDLEDILGRPIIAS